MVNSIVALPCFTQYTIPVGGSSTIRSSIGTKIHPPTTKKASMKPPA